MAFLATFTAADNTLVTAYTPDVGGGSLVLADNNSSGAVARIFSNRAYADAAANYTLFRHSVTASSADYAVEADIRFTSNLTSASGAVAIRLAGSTGATLNGYLVLHTAGGWQFYKIVSGTYSTLSTVFTQALTVGNTYKVKIEAVGTTLKYYTDNADGVLVLRNTITDSSVSAAGAPGFWVNRGSTTTGYHIDRVEEVAVGTPATATTLTGPTTGTVGVASSNFTAGANGDITGTVTITPGDGGAGGTFTPTTVNISSGTPTATFTYTAASSGAKTISIADNGGLTDATPITYTASAASNPVSGTASLSSTTATTINVTCGAASSGTPSYTYQWYRSPTANFTPGGGTLLSGATSLTLADSTGLSADTPYYYRLRVTDSLSNTGDSNEIAGVLKAATLSIGFIGDSITNAFGLSAGQGPVDQAGNLLVKLYKNRAVTVTKYAVDGTRTGQWLSGSANLIAAKAAFASASSTHVHIMFGANDAAAANLVSAATYKSNLQNIITDLTGAGYKVILSYPTYIPAGANSNATTAASVALAQSYQAQIDDLVDGVNVLRGDVLSYNYFIANLGEYQTDKTHPTATGATSLGYMWSRAIERAIFFLDKPVPTKTVTVTFKDRTGALQANLTGLKWQWSDVPGQPIDYGTGATTNASGVFSITVRSYLQTAEVGFLEVTNAAGVVNTTYLSFAGPAAVA